MVLSVKRVGRSDVIKAGHELHCSSRREPPDTFLLSNTRWDLHETLRNVDEPSACYARIYNTLTNPNESLRHTRHPTSDWPEGSDSVWWSSFLLEGQSRSLYKQFDAQEPLTSERVLRQYYISLVRTRSYTIRPFKSYSKPECDVDMGFGLD